MEQVSQLYIKELNALAIIFGKDRGVHPYRQSDYLKIHAHIKNINYFGE